MILWESRQITVQHTFMQRNKHSHSLYLIHIHFHKFIQCFFYNNEWFNSYCFVSSLKKINHFPSMGEICRKDNLAWNMAKWVFNQFVLVSNFHVILTSCITILNTFKTCRLKWKLITCEYTCCNYDLQCFKCIFCISWDLNIYTCILSLFHWEQVWIVG